VQRSVVQPGRKGLAAAAAGAGTEEASYRTLEQTDTSLVPSTSAPAPAGRVWQPALLARTITADPVVRCWLAGWLPPPLPLPLPAACCCRRWICSRCCFCRWICRCFCRCCRWICCCWCCWLVLLAGAAGWCC
jgi:hypothetical protein